MIKIDGIEYRNLEEQVQYNSSTIQSLIEGNETIGRFGIKIVGQYPTAELIPPADTYEGEYGDAFLIGTAAPYDYYIYTRPFEEGQGNQWFSLGKFPAVGPEGPTGPEGPEGVTGERGSLWFSNSEKPITTSGYNIGDYCFIPGSDPEAEGEPGSVYHLHDVNGVKTWLYEGNIRGPQGLRGPIGRIGQTGPQGPEGPQGPAGPAGPIVDMVGTATLDQLASIDPESVPRQTGYLVNVGGENHVYIIIGEEGNLSWYDAGLFGTGTQVLVNGSPVSSFNANTKVDKLDGNSFVYGVDEYSQVGRINFNQGVVGDTLAKRLSNGTLRGAAPEDDRDLVNLKYYKDNITSRLNKVDTIFSRNLPSGGTYTDYVSSSEYGLYFVCGQGAKVSFKIGGTTYNTTNNFHMFIISDPTNAGNSISYFSVGGSSILDASVKMLTGELASNITIETGSASVLFSKMGLKQTQNKV